MEALFNKINGILKDAVENIRIIYFEKGAGPFKKPLMFAVSAVLILYLALYSPLSSKVARKKSEVYNLEAIAAHYNDYENVRTRFMDYQKRLPSIKDKDEWLSYILTSLARKHGIVFETFSSQTEVEMDNLLIVSREATMTTSYSKLGKWLSEMENSKIFIKVTEFNLKKDENLIGAVKVSLTVSTIFMKYAAQAGSAAGVPGPADSGMPANP